MDLSYIDSPARVIKLLQVIKASINQSSFVWNIESHDALVNPCT